MGDIKKGFYTAIYSDRIPIDQPGIFEKMPGFDYFLFTNLDPKLFNTSWTIIQTNKFHTNNCLSAKFIKWNISKFLPEYDYLIFMDGYFSPKSSKKLNFDEYINNLEKYDIILINHLERNCIYNELKAIVKYKKDSKKKVSLVLNHLIKDNYPKNFGLFSTGFFFLNNKKKELQIVLAELYNFLTKNSHRDQSAINYIFWKFKFTNFLTLPDTTFNNLLDKSGKIGNHSYI